MTTVPFIKMQGLGNDYVYIDCFPPETAKLLAKVDLASLARRVSDRHYGVGSDGLVLIMPDEKSDAGMRIFNADGSEAQMCGNAIRCVAKYLYESGLCHRSHMEIMTKAGPRALNLYVSNEEVKQVTVNMGVPRIKPDTFRLDNEPLGFTSINMGNPHTVFFRDALPSAEELAVLGKRIGTHPHFPEGTNVEFVRICNREELEVRVWERGTGETLACGTGACAAAVAAIRQELTERKVTVHLRGGDLLIQWDYNHRPVFMTGPAVEVFRGEYTW